MSDLKKVAILSERPYYKDYSPVKIGDIVYIIPKEYIIFEKINDYYCNISTDNTKFLEGHLILKNSVSMNCGDGDGGYLQTDGRGGYPQYEVKLISGEIIKFREHEFYFKKIENPY
jgi:hypothetical protein